MSHPDHDLVVVIDFGAQYAQLIARRVREARVYSEIMPHTATVAEIAARRPKAVILSGGPQSVYAPGAPQVDPALFAAGVPAFGICYGFQAMARALGGDVAKTGLSEFGRTEATVTDARAPAGRAAALAAGLDEPRRLGGRRPGRVHRAGRQRRGADRRLRGRRPAGWPGCSGTPRCCTPRPASGCWRTSCSTSPAAARTGRRPTSSTTRCRPIQAQVGRQAPDLRAVRRRGLRGGRGAGAAGGGQPADLRLRRPRPAAARARPSRWSGTSWPPPGSTSRWSTPPTSSSARWPG